MSIGSDWHDSGATALGPAGLQPDVIILDRVVRSELDGFLSPQAKGGLQPQAHGNVFVRDSCELFLFEIPGP